MLSLIKGADDAYPEIHEVGWRLRRPITPEALRRDMAYAAEQALDVHGWRGEDRTGRPMDVVWVQIPNGHVLAAYEIQEA